MAPSHSPKATPPKSATSRLLAMKFMSRLGPADATPTASSPLAASPSTPTRPGAPDGAEADADADADDRPSAKRRKVTGAAAAGRAAVPSPSPGAGAGGTSIADMEAAMRASMDEEERRRQAAVSKRAAELGDEHWTWDTPLPPHVAAKLAANHAAANARLPYAVVRVGFAEIDGKPEGAAGSAVAPAAGSTKPNIMRFNMKQTAGADEESSDDAAEDAGEGRSRKRPRAESEAQKAKKKKDAPKLKHLTSLSSQGGQSAMKCHRCGRPGHKAVECPSASSQQRRPGSRKR